MLMLLWEEQVVKVNTLTYEESGRYNEDAIGR